MMQQLIEGSQTALQDSDKYRDIRSGFWNYSNNPSRIKISFRGVISVSSETETFRKHFGNVSECFGNISKVTTIKIIKYNFFVWKCTKFIKSLNLGYCNLLFRYITLRFGAFFYVSICFDHNNSVSLFH